MDESRMLVDAVGAVWPEEPGPEEAAIEPALVDALRALDTAGPDEAESAQDRVLAVLGEAPDLHRRVESAIRATLLGAERGVGSPQPQGVAERRSEVEIAYATDRVPTGRPGEFYGPGRDRTLRCGRAWVALPDDRRIGELPRPKRRWRLRFRRPGDTGLRLEESASLTATVAGMRDRAPGRDVLVFVHGYNVSFAEAVRRTAQLAYDVDFGGVPVLYIWPSAGSPAAYVADGAAADGTQRRFRTFLTSLLESTDGGRVHVIAHSMGNRVLTEALSGLAGYRLGHVVFAAPDLDAEQFRDRVADFSGTAERYTLYVNDSDLALAASGSYALANAPRAGAGGIDELVLDGIDTIDASRVETGLLGHSYAMERRTVVSDIHLLIHHDHPPNARPGLRLMMSRGGPYWEFRP
ncbi:alpha/beta hydrolase [Micromonospora sp. NPDC005222]|uniref:alpha/beta hydrolase n=1 Tax=unclassified Micromonospora TaxID=2617518 RepID=UPI0033B5BC10